MNQDCLADLIEQPEVQKLILNDYEGGYSLGVTLNPADRSQLAIRVRVKGEDVRIPSQITLEGETIPIVVHRNFQVPEPLGQSQ